MSEERHTARWPGGIGEVSAERGIPRPALPCARRICQHRSRFEGREGNVRRSSGLRDRAPVPLAIEHVSPGKSRLQARGVLMSDSSTASTRSLRVGSTRTSVLTRCSTSSTRSGDSAMALLLVWRDATNRGCPSRRGCRDPRRARSRLRCAIRETGRAALGSVPAGVPIRVPCLATIRKSCDNVRAEKRVEHKDLEDC